jgi:hypothetical protein
MIRPKAGFISRYDTDQNEEVFDERITDTLSL